MALPGRAHSNLRAPNGLEPLIFWSVVDLRRDSEDLGGLPKYRDLVRLPSVTLQGPQYPLRLRYQSRYQEPASAEIRRHRAFRIHCWSGCTLPLAFAVI